MKNPIIIFTLLILTTTLYAQTINDFERLLQMKAVIVDRRQYKSWFCLYDRGIYHV
jgi:hypothetical protein